MSMIRNACVGLLALSSVVLAATAPASAQQPQRKPNIVVIMGDDVGWFNIGASEGMLFTDYYAEASCTAGRANFITGELPIRTGLTTV